MRLALLLLTLVSSPFSLALDTEEISDNFDCFACHTLADDGVGPSFEAIALRYTEKDKPLLIDKIINGGVGNWGQEMMLAHPDIDNTTAEKLVDFIFSTKKNSQGNNVQFKNPLSQRIYDAVKAPLQLSLNESYSDLHEIKTLKGDVIGSVHVFNGLRLEKMVVSEFITGPGMVASLVVIKPEYQYDVPRFGSDFSVMNNKLHLDLDLFPHKDLAADSDYFEEDFATLEQPYLQACEDFVTMQPRGLWLRNFISPYFFMTDAELDQQAPLEDLAESYLETWLSIWQKHPTEISEGQQQAVLLRAQHFERLSMANNPVKAMFTTMLGEELALRSLTALY